MGYIEIDMVRERYGAATGCRAGEATSIRLIDLDFSRKPSRLLIRGEYTKTNR